MNKHICRRCGTCCIIHWGSFEATHADLTRWKRQRRLDILKHLTINSEDPTNLSGTFTSDRCPFLRKGEKRDSYYCTINETKPSYCQNYPSDGICEYPHD